MAKEDRQKLTLNVEATGFGQAAKEVDKLTAAKNRLVKEVMVEGSASDETIEQVRELTEAQERLVEQTQKLQKSTEELNEKVGRGKSKLRESGDAAFETAEGFAKVALAIRATVAAFRLLPGISAIVAGGRAIVGALRDEITERLRLIEVIREQSRARDKQVNEQVELEATLRRVAGRRRIGGFATPEIAAEVEARATTAQKQFTRLSPEDINQAFGTFGDVGFSQEELTKLAIIASFGELKVELRRSRPELKGRGGRLIKQFDESGRIGKFLGVETVVGEGLGAEGFRRAGPTKRQQRALEQLITPKEGETIARERLAELGLSKEDIELALQFGRMFKASKEFEAAKVGVFTDLRPFTALSKLARTPPGVDIALQDQPGVQAAFHEFFGLTENFEEIRLQQFTNILRAFEQVEKEGIRGGSGVRGGAPSITINNNQNSRFFGVDKASMERRSRYGSKLATERERL